MGSWSARRRPSLHLDGWCWTWTAPRSRFTGSRSRAPTNRWSGTRAFSIRRPVGIGRRGWWRRQSSTLGRREKCLRKRSEKGSFPGVACPPDAEPPPSGAAQTLWTKTGLRPCRARLFGLQSELESESQNGNPGSIMQADRHVQALSVVREAGGRERRRGEQRRRRENAQTSAPQTRPHSKLEYGSPSPDRGAAATSPEIAHVAGHPSDLTQATLFTIGSPACSSNYGGTRRWAKQDVRHMWC